MELELHECSAWVFRRERRIEDVSVAVGLAVGNLFRVRLRVVQRLPNHTLFYSRVVWDVPGVLGFAVVGFVRIEQA
jgi:hypothetical protein